MTVILVNCVTLGMYEPCPAEKEHVCDRNCQILKVVDKIKGIVKQEENLRAITGGGGGAIDMNEFINVQFL
jgi:hypothetical protein